MQFRIILLILIIILICLLVAIIAISYKKKIKLVNGGEIFSREELTQYGVNFDTLINLYKEYINYNLSDTEINEKINEAIREDRLIDIYNNIIISYNLSNKNTLITVYKKYINDNKSIEDQLSDEKIDELITNAINENTLNEIYDNIKDALSENDLQSLSKLMDNSIATFLSDLTSTELSIFNKKTIDNIEWQNQSSIFTPIQEKISRFRLNSDMKLGEISSIETRLQIHTNNTHDIFDIDKNMLKSAIIHYNKNLIPEINKELTTFNSKIRRKEKKIKKIKLEDQIDRMRAEISKCQIKYDNLLEIRQQITRLIELYKEILALVDTTNNIKKSMQILNDINYDTIQKELQKKILSMYTYGNKSPNDNLKDRLNKSQWKFNNWNVGYMLSLISTGKFNGLNVYKPAIYPPILFYATINVKTNNQLTLSVEDIIQEYKNIVEAEKNEYILKNNKIIIDYDEIQKELQDNILLLPKFTTSLSNPTDELNKLGWDLTHIDTMVFDSSDHQYNPKKYIDILKYAIILLLEEKTSTPSIIINDSIIINKYKELVDVYKNKQVDEIKQYCTF